MGKSLSYFYGSIHTYGLGDSEKSPRLEFEDSESVYVLRICKSKTMDWNHGVMVQ